MSASVSRVVAVVDPFSPGTGTGEGYNGSYIAAPSPPAPLSPSAFASPPFTRSIRDFSLNRPPSYSSLASVPLSPSADYSSFLDLLQWPTSPLSSAPSPLNQPQLLPSQSATAFSSLAMAVPIPPLSQSAQQQNSHTQPQGHSHGPGAGYSQGSAGGGVAALFPSTASSAPLPFPSSSSLSPFVLGSTSSAVGSGSVASLEGDGRSYPVSLLGKREREYEATVPQRRPPQPPATYNTTYPSYETYDKQHQPSLQVIQPHSTHPPIVSYPSSTLSAEPAPQPSQLTPTFLPPQPDYNPVMYRKSSCLLCHRAKTSCDGRRPCDRCIRLDRQNLCVERVRPKGGTATKKKTAGKKGKKEAEEEKDDDDEDEDVTVKKEHEEDKEDKEDKDKDEEMDDQTAKSDDKSKADSASTGSTSPLPKPNTITLSLVPAGSSSPGASSSSSLFGSEALVGVDERELSSTFLRVLQSDQVQIQSILKQASVRKSIPPMAFQAFISYIANSLHPDDFSAFLNSLDVTNGDKKGMEALEVDRLHVRLPDGRLMPRVLFTFRKSSLDALPDSERGVDMAMIYIYRVPNVQARMAAAAETSSGGAEKSKSTDGESIVREQREEAGATPTSHSALNSVPGTPASPDPNTPAGQQSVKSTDSNDSNDPTSPSSSSTASSSSSSLSGSGSPSAPSQTAGSPTDSNNLPASGTTASSSSSPSLPHLSPPEAYPPFVPAPVPGANFDSLSEVDLVIQVNREFERLFGYSQREMKALMMREQAKVNELQNSAQLPCSSLLSLLFTPTLTVRLSLSASVCFRRASIASTRPSRSSSSADG